MSGFPSTLLSSKRSRGRPREFDLEQALEGAMRVFQERGYQATSIADLSAGMNLASGSIYKAFKDKRSVFLAAFERYVARHNTLIQAQLPSSGSGRERLRRMLQLYVGFSHDVEGQRGCLVVGSTIELSILDQELGERVTAVLNENEAFLVGLVRQGQQDGSVSQQLDSEAAGRLLLCVLQGMRVIGKTGRSQQDLAAVVELALKVLD